VVNSLPSGLMAPQAARKQRRFRHVHELLLEISVLEMELQRLRMEEGKLFRRMDQIQARKTLLGQQQSQLYRRLKISDAGSKTSLTLASSTYAPKMPEGSRHRTWEY